MARAPDLVRRRTRHDFIVAGISPNFTPTQENCLHLCHQGSSQPCQLHDQAGCRHRVPYPRGCTYLVVFEMFHLCSVFIALHALVAPLI